MAVIDRIPMPGTGFDGLVQGSDWMHKLLMAPVERRYKEAEMQKAAEAAEAQRRMEPLKMDLIRAQIQNMQSLASSRAKTSSMLSGLTKANTTKNQAVIQAIDNVTPLIHGLKDSDFPGQTIGKYIHPDRQAAYEAKSAAITDSLVAALGLPKTNESIHLIGKMVNQKSFESDASYKKRLEDLVSDLGERKKKALSNIQTGVGQASFDGNDMSELDPLGVLE